MVQSDTEQIQCIACLESDGDLIRLNCKCTESNWHESCYRKWVHAQINRKSQVGYCMVCKHKYTNVRVTTVKESHKGTNDFTESGNQTVCVDILPKMGFSVMLVITLLMLI